MTDTANTLGPVELQKIQSPYASGCDGFGHSSVISADGNTMAIASLNVKDGVPGIFIFVNKEGNWVFYATLVPRDSVQSSSFGENLSITRDGSILIASCPGDSEHKDRAGAVYVFQHIGNHWTQVDKIVSQAPQSGARFGTAAKISKDGTVITIGAPFEKTESESRGAVYLFSCDRYGKWVQAGKLLAADKQTDDLFGASIDLAADGSFLAVGAPNATSLNRKNSGAAYLFQHRNGAWQQVARLIPSDLKENTYFGAEVRLAENLTSLVIQAPGDGAISPILYVFEKAGVIWVQSTKLLMEKWTSSAYLIHDFQISLDGTKLVVSSAYRSKDVVKTTYATQVSLLTKLDGVWDSGKDLVPIDVVAEDVRGSSLAVTPDFETIVASYWSMNNSGASYVFK